MMKEMCTDGIFNWIKDFLVGSMQTVSVEHETSETCAVRSGVPQGTVLGPILFVVYINDLLDEVDADGLLYADDTKIFRCISDWIDAVSLQNDINKLEEWAVQWLMNEISP